MSLLCKGEWLLFGQFLGIIRHLFLPLSGHTAPDRLPIRLCHLGDAVRRLHLVLLLLNCLSYHSHTSRYVNQTTHARPEGENTHQLCKGNCECTMAPCFTVLDDRVTLLTLQLIADLLVLLNPNQS